MTRPQIHLEDGDCHQYKMHQKSLTNQSATTDYSTRTDKRQQQTIFGLSSQV